MKRIDAFIPPHRLSKVVCALHELPHFAGFTLWDARGQGRGRGPGGHYVHDDECLVYREQLVLTVICEDAEMSSIAHAIAIAAHTGNEGDGLVTVSDVTQVEYIRDAEPPETGRA